MYLQTSGPRKDLMKYSQVVVCAIHPLSWWKSYLQANSTDVSMYLLKNDLRIFYDVKSFRLENERKWPTFFQSHHPHQTTGEYSIVQHWINWCRHDLAQERKGGWPVFSVLTNLMRKIHLGLVTWKAVTCYTGQRQTHTNFGVRQTWLWISALL